jgi:hypothetical protein
VARSGVFLRDDASVNVFSLEEPLRDIKRRMIACFATQRETLRQFDSAAPERFRPAPVYDFCQLPHEPPLLYDLYDWGIKSAEWRARAARFIAADRGNAECR